jgi:hypothetical protein
MLKNFSVIFTANSGRLSYTIEAKTEMEAIRMALEMDKNEGLMGTFYKVEAIQNMDHKRN